MATRKSSSSKKTFTVVEANSTLPLVRAIVRDVTELAHEQRERHERLNRLRPRDRGGLSEAHEEELRQAQIEFERAQERMREFEKELHELGVELKDYFSGLVDFPCWMNGRLVYLCWRQGEPEIAYWHELEAGFSGRRKLMVDAGRR